MKPGTHLPGELVGPDGQVIAAPGFTRVKIEKTDAGVTYTTGEEAVTLTPEELLMAMARRQRDGASLAAIKSEFDLIGEARNPFVLQRALAMGRELLDRAIAEGRQPAETFGERLVIVEDGEE